MEKKFTYKEGDVEEIITIQFTPDAKGVISATHQSVGCETYPISFVDMEYAEDLELFIGGATSKTWQGEVMIGVESDFSKLGWNDGQTKKSFFNAT